MQDGGILLEYDEEQEGERAHVVLTAGSRQAAMRRRGGMSGTLRFVPGERTSSTYETDYGEIPVGGFYAQRRHGAHADGRRTAA